jgi:hypothetical protein
MIQLVRKSCIITSKSLVLLWKMRSLIKTCQAETNRRVRARKNLSDMFPIRNGLRKGDDLSSLLSTLLHIKSLGGFA